MKRFVARDDGLRGEKVEGQEPLARFRAGQITCALWQNEINVNGIATTILKASVNRRYKGRNGKWKSSQSFSRNEIPLAIDVLQKALERMNANTDGQWYETEDLSYE